LCHRVFVTEHIVFFFFSSRRRHTRFSRDWSSDVCSSDLFHVWRATHVARTRGEIEQDLRANPPEDPEHWGNLSRVEHASSMIVRSEERRVGKECRSWWGGCHERKRIQVCDETTISVVTHE